MISSFIRSVIFSVSLTIMWLVPALASVASMDAEATQNQPEVEMEGNYSGYILINEGKEKVEVGIIVSERKGDEYEAVLYFGGLPWEQGEDADDPRTIELHGTYRNYTLRLTGDFPLDFQFIHNRLTALDEENTYKGHLEKVIRIDGNS